MKHQLRMQFRKNATESDLIELAQTIVSHENDTVKSLLLLVFQGKYLFPLEISPLIEYAQSDNELLAETAIDRLKEFKNKRIHDLAVQLLETKGVNSFALALLTNNYQKSDDIIITKAVAKSASIPHHVQQDIRDIYNKNRSTNAFSTLYRVYKGGECSFCRESVVRAMNRCGVLSDELLEECLFDSYDDTRKYAKRVLSRR